MSDMDEPREGDRIECSASDGFRGWLSQVGGSVVITTYQAGKVALVGWDGRQITLLMRHFPKPMGLAIAGQRLALATRHEVCLFANAPLLARDYLENEPGRYDAIYLPRVTYYTGDCNIHDLAFGQAGLWLVNTRFSCLSAMSDEYSFVPRWQPKFISQLCPEDRCHLNGIAMMDGRPKWVTALGETDDVGGWRANKATGGIILDVESGEIVLRGLAMPHSPRWHDGRLWVLDSGAGELCTVDPARSQKTVVCALPGYLRGLRFVGPFAMVGMSKIREKHIFGGLPVQDRHPSLQCGVAIVDIRSGRPIGQFEFTAGCTELFEVQHLAGVRRPTILNLSKEAVREAFTAPDFSYWIRPSTEIPPTTPGGNSPRSTVN